MGICKFIETITITFGVFFFFYLLAFVFYETTPISAYVILGVMCLAVVLFVFMAIWEVLE